MVRLTGVRGLLQPSSVGDDLKCMMGEVQEIAIGNSCHFLGRSGDQRGGWEGVFGRVGLTLSHKWWSQTWLKISAGIVVKAVLDRVGARTWGNVEMEIK